MAPVDYGYRIYPTRKAEIEILQWESSKRNAHAVVRDIKTGFIYYAPWAEIEVKRKRGFRATR